MLKRKIWAALVTLAMLVSYGQAAVFAENGIIPDWSFEEGKWGFGDNTTQMMVSDEAAYEGNHSMKVTNQAVDKDNAYIDFDLKANTNYKLTFYTRSAWDWGALVKLHSCGAKWKELVSQTTSPSENGADWKKVTVKFTTNDETKYRITIVGNVYGNEIPPIYFDAFEIIEQMADKTGEIVNGGFENGDQLWSLPDNGVYTITAEDAQEGANALRIHGIGNYTAVRRTISVAANTKYVLSFYAKKSGNDNAFVKIFRGDTEDADALLSQINMTSGEWRRYTYELDLGEDTQFRILIFDGGATAYYDNFALTKVDAGKLILDGGFENGGLGWNFGDQCNLDADAYKGKYSARLPGGGDGWSQRISQVVNLEKNTDYILSFYAKAPKDWSALCKIKDGALYSSGISSNGDWTYQTVAFNSGDNETTEVAFVWSENETRIDNVALVKAADYQEPSEDEDIEPIIKGVPADFSGKSDLTVGFIGGSVTQGAGAAAFTDTWVYKTAEYLENRTGLPVNPVYAGIGGTGSDFGVYRLYDQVLKYSPDIVFIEFSVNDIERDKAEVQKNMEGMIRAILSMPKKVSIILVFTANDDFSGVSNTHQEVANYYGIPTINIKNYIRDCIENGQFAWSDISGDKVHPNSYGYGLYAEYIQSVLNSEFGKYVCYNDFVETPMTDCNYVTPRLLPPEAAQLGEGWRIENNMLVSDVKNAQCTLTFSGTSFGFYKNEPDGTSLNLSIDGQEYGESWVNFGAPYRIITESLENKAHTVTITNNADDGIRVSLAGFMIDDASTYEYPEEMAADNKIINGSFEAGKEGWDMGNHWSVTDEAAYSGRYALKINNSGSGSDYCSTTQRFKVEKNTDYVLRYYYKGTGDFVMKLLDPKTGAAIVQDFPKGTEDWTLAAVPWNSGEYTQIELQFMDNLAVMYIDDITFVKKTDRFNILDQQFTDGTKAITGLTGIARAYGTCLLDNQSGAEQKAAVVAALYQNGVLVKADYQDYTVAAGGIARAEIMLDGIQGEGYTMKLFVLDGMSGIQPYCDAAEIR